MKRLLPGHPFANRSTGFEADESGKICEYCGDCIADDAEESVCEKCEAEFETIKEKLATSVKDGTDFSTFAGWLDHFIRKLESGIFNEKEISND